MIKKINQPKIGWNLSESDLIEMAFTKGLTTASESKTLTLKILTKKNQTKNYKIWEKRLI